MKSLVAEAVQGVAKGRYDTIYLMTKLLEEGIRAVQELPAERQDVAGEILLTIAGDSDRYQLTAEQIEDVKLAMVETDRGEFASDKEVADMWKEFGL